MSPKEIMSLSELKEHNFELWYYKIEIILSTPYSPCCYHVTLPDFLCSESWCWEAGDRYLPWDKYYEELATGKVKSTINHKTIETTDAVKVIGKPFRKKYTKILIEFDALALRASFLQKLFAKSAVMSQPDNYNPVFVGWPLPFVHKINGDICFCSCFRRTVEKYASRVLTEPRAWFPPYLKESLTDIKFKDGICHLCRGIPSTNMHEYIDQVGLELYGESFAFYTPEIETIPLQERITIHKEHRRHVENLVRGKMGVPLIGEKWQNETKLYKLISHIFSKHQTVREATPDWITPQRLDIYIPDLRLAIEYQGEQHYKPISIFGGEAGLMNTKKRDEIKKVKCIKNNIDLVYFSYHDDISEETVRSKLHKYIEAEG